MRLRIIAGQQFVDGFDTAHRADPARRALAATFDSTKFKGKTRHFRHVDTVIENRDPAMANQPTGCSKGLVIKNRVEHMRREIGPQWPADLYGAHRPATRRAAANAVDQRPQRHPEGRFEQAAIPDIARQLDRHGAARSPVPEFGIGRGSIGKDMRNRHQAEDIVDHRRHPEQALVRRQRRLGTHLAAFAFDRFEQRGFLAANIGARTDAHFDVEIIEPAGVPRRADRRVHRCNRVRIFGSDVQIAMAGAHAQPANRHALDQQERITLHDHPIGKGAAVAFIGVADDIFPLARCIGDGFPFDAGRKPGTATAAQPRRLDRIDPRLCPQRAGPGQADTAAVRDIIVKAGRIDNAAARKGHPLLPGEERLVTGLADAQRMRATIEQSGRDKPIDIIGANRAIADPPRGRGHFDQRFKPVHSARAIAHDRQVQSQPVGMSPQRRRNIVGSARHRDRITGHIDRPGHAIAFASNTSSRCGDSRANTCPSSIADGAAEHSPRQ